MKADILGGPSAGKSTMAALLAQLIQGERAKKAKRGGQPEPGIVGIATTDGSAPHLEAAGIETVKRARTLRDIEAIISKMQQGDICILDDCTEPYLLAIQGYLAQANDFRRTETKGKSEDPFMSPDAWRAVNVRYYNAIAGACMRQGVDLVQVHREGEVYMLDPSLGLVPGQGFRARGQSESGTQSNLLLHVHGGIHSRHRYPGDRLLYVVSDTAYLATGEPLALRNIRSEADFAYVRAGMKRLLQKSIEKALRATDKNRDLWKALDSAPDLWPEAAHASDEGEKLLLADEAETLLRTYGLDGQTGEIKGKRARLLKEIFGVSTVPLFKESPVLTPKVIRAGLKELERRLAADAEEQRKAEAARVASIEAKGKP